MIYLNEIDQNAAIWLANLIDAGELPAGKVDTRSIKDVRPSDIAGCTQAHFFAGIGGWPLALRLAGWPVDRPVWTGSCPCQPYSSAGKGKGDADDRNLWPDFFRLIRECRPPVVIGEQVSSAIGHGWLDGISADLESEGYAVGAVVLGACAVGAPHRRQRLFWVASLADSAGALCAGRKNGRAGSGHAGEGCGRAESERGLHAGPLAYTRCERLRSGGHRTPEPEAAGVQGADGEWQRLRADVRAGGIGTGSVVHPYIDGFDSRRAPAETTGHGRSALADGSFGGWSDYRVIHCRDGKARRTQRSLQPLAHGIPRELGRGIPELARMARSARSNRVGRLKGYGNAIVPEVAAVFVRAFIEASSRN